MAHPISTIGRNAYVEFVGHTDVVPAKVDTGADSSAVWASMIRIDEDHRLHFVLFDKQSPYYTGDEIIATNYSVSQVRSSSGHTQIRYRVPLSIRVAGRRVKATFTLANRQKNKFPILIGRRTLARRFVVDVSIAECDESAGASATRTLNDELDKNPYEFYKKYHRTSSKNDKEKK